MANTHGSRRFTAASISLLLLSPVVALAATPPVAAQPEPGTTVGASDFAYFMYPLAKVNVGACTGTAEEVTSAPFYSNSDCGYTTFTLTGGSAETVKARLFAEDSQTPFAVEEATSSGSSGYQVDLEPPASWPSGLVRMEVVADGEPVGESTFGLDMLGATLSAEDTVEAGQDIPVTGTVSTLDSGPVTDDGEGVPATFTLEVTSPEGATLHRRQVTADADGAFAVTVPGEATRDVHADSSTDYRTAVGLSAVDATYENPETTDTWSAGHAGSGSATVLSPPTTLQLENSFVSSVGWVKPGETYPSRLFVENPTDQAYENVTVTVPAPDGTTFTQARPGAGAGTAAVESGTVVWDLGTVPAAGEGGPTRRSLVLEAKAHSLAKDPEVVWKNLSSTATLSIDGAADQETATSHGPRVIPPSETFDTARYGDRPFPVVPVDYRDRKHQAASSGDELSDVINSPWVEGSTFNLFQEMSLGQLFPHGTVPSAGIASAGFGYEPGFDFTTLDPQGTCSGVTVGQDGAGTPLYAERIKDGFYQLPGDTAYYGADRYGSALAGAIAGIGPLMDIDSACGPTGKLVRDAAAIADPEIDYSDYDTDKDGVVDFFMVVFAGCGGHGASQLSVAACPYAGAPYDNVWPHSSSLESYYTDEETGLPGFVTDDQLKDLEGRPLFYADSSRTEMTTNRTDFPVKVRVGPYNVNPETAIDKASVISHEYGHSLGLPDFYSLGSRETYGDWNLMATDKSQNMDVFSRQELGWVVPEVLEPGQTRVEGWTDSKQDTHSVTWQRPDGTAYTLEGPEVHNSQAYVAKLPGRQLIDPATFETGDGASPTHAWWSGSGNDFGCAPESAHNLDLVVPGLSDLPDGSTVTLEMKSLWDIEWDYDYGFVLTSADGGETYASQKSEEGYTTETSNPNQNACQGKYGNGLTGSSGSYEAGSTETDRLLGDYPKPLFLSDRYDISELAGAESPVVRFSYATDPGLARPGWFVDDLKVTAETPSGEEILLATDLEDDGGPDDPRFFNGGCKEDLRVATRCTKGWSHVDSSAEAPADHAYYLELRDRSGFDLDSNGENDRDPIGFEPGLSLVYTDEAHGYGNVGTDNPPAQSPLDATPEPGSDTPDLDDAAFTAAAGRSSFTDSGKGHTDNYSDPSQTEQDSRYPDVDDPWRFLHDCLSFDVGSMSGQQPGPARSDGDLTADVTFDLGDGCGTFDYGYGEPEAAPANTAPTAKASARPRTVEKGGRVTLSAAGSTDAETPDDLDYSWNFDDGGTTKDATGPTARVRFRDAGVHDVVLTVTDPAGGTDRARTRVDVTRSLDCEARAVDRTGSWRSVPAAAADGGAYCDNLGSRSGRDTMRLAFTGRKVTVHYARARRGGTATVLVDGEKAGTLSFDGRARQPRFGFTRTYSDLGDGSHTIRLVVRGGAAYVDRFVILGRPR